MEYFIILYISFKILGKICRICQIYGDGDLRVTFNGSGFTLNSTCCSNVPKHQADIHNTIAYHNMEDATLRCNS